MGENASEALKIFAIIALTCLVIGLAFKIYNQSADATNVATDQIDSLKTAMAEEKYTTYDGKIVYGSDVISAIKSFRSDAICVQVDNGGGDVKTYIYSDTTLQTKSEEKVAKATNKRNIGNGYINPSSKYESELVYDDATGSIIVGINFTVVTADA